MMREAITFLHTLVEISRGIYYFNYLSGRSSESLLFGEGSGQKGEIVH